MEEKVMIISKCLPDAGILKSNGVDSCYLLWHVGQGYVLRLVLDMKGVCCLKSRLVKTRERLARIRWLEFGGGQVSEKERVSGR